MTSSDRVVPGEDPSVRIATFRSQGMTVKEAAKAAGYSERHAYRLLERYDEGPRRFERWSPASAHQQDPPEKIEWLFTTYMDGGWFVEDADIAWRIHCADPDLEPWLIKAFCHLYVAARHAETTLRTRNRMIIDWALWNRIWEDSSQMENYVDTLPVTTSEELDFAAEVAHYLSRYAPVELEPEDSDQDEKPRLRVRTVVSGVENRWDYFVNARERAAEEEARKLEEALAARRLASNVPGESIRRVKLKSTKRS